MTYCVHAKFSSVASMFNKSLFQSQVSFYISVIPPIPGGRKHGEWLVGGDGTMLLPGHGGTLVVHRCTGQVQVGPGHTMLSDQARQARARQL